MGDIFKSSTFRLFARPSAVEGIARLFDFGGSLQMYCYSKDGDEADLKASQSDWDAVGKDLKTAMKNHEQAQSQSA